MVDNQNPNSSRAEIPGDDDGIKSPSGPGGDRLLEELESMESKNIQVAYQAMKPDGQIAPGGAGKVFKQVFVDEDDEQERLLEIKIGELSDSLPSKKDYKKLVEARKELLNLHIDKYGEDSKPALKSLASLAETYREDEKYNDAAAYYLRRLDLLRKISGKDDLNTVDAVTDLAEVNALQKNWPGAISNYEKAISIYKQEYGRENYSVIKTLYGLGTVYQKAEKYDDAARCFSRRIELSTSIFGENSHITAEMHEDFAQYSADRNNWKDVASSYEKALKICSKEKKGTNSDAIINALYHLGWIYQRGKKYDDAAGCFSQCIDKTKISYGEHSLEFSKAIGNFAELKVEQKDWQKAADNYEKAIAICLMRHNKISDPGQFRPNWPARLLYASWQKRYAQVIDQAKKSGFQTERNTDNMRRTAANIFRDYDAAVEQQGQTGFIVLPVNKDKGLPEEQE